eukprot:TRINITY_DN1427_c0_g2_i4.p1 TRINITY_DN1427_c0_g2~~TRINITY_DN1427_c0_g2_i4.p1  ORF type:complete len:237 (+),score=51.34 TRINITY_DN1427_c0_g2_i4:29-739(+)
MIGVLRTKPGRGIPTRSMSCSDKMARWNVCGIQGSLLSSFLVSPIMIDDLIVGDLFSLEAMERAVFGRLVHAIPWIHQPKIRLTKVSFGEGKVECIRKHKGEDAKGSNICVNWNANDQSVEATLGTVGRLASVPKKNASNPKFAPRLSKVQMLELYHTLLSNGSEVASVDVAAGHTYTYEEAKHSSSESIWTELSSDISPHAVSYKERRSILLSIWDKWIQADWTKLYQFKPRLFA